MKKQLNRLQRAQAVLATRKFWWFIMALLVLQAAWIALSGRYPMAFDEDFHLGIIKLYAHHISPFWSHQPEAADPFGAVARDPSYLYQYLMSFPYRLLKLVTSDENLIIIIFRFINIAFFASGLVIFRRLLLKARVSQAVVHFCLLLFVLVPIVPLLAAQINYDNLWLPLVALTLLQTLKFDEVVRLQKRIDARLVLQLAISCMLTSIVKYAFLPIMLAIIIFLLVRIWQVRRQLDQKSWLVSWRKLSLGLKLGLAAGLVLSATLFSERIGLNLLRYHTPVPDCSKVLSVDACSEYGPWIRDYNFKLNKVTSSHNPVTYTADWFYGMWLRIFFAVSGPLSDYETRGPLLLPGMVPIVMAALGTLAFVLTAKRIFKRYDSRVLWLFAAVSSSYIGFLWLDEFRAWLQTGQPVAINGRYLLPVLPLIMLLMALALIQLFKRRQRLLLGLAVFALIGLAWGGGALTFILRSNPNWYWNNAAVRSANNAVHNVVGPFVPGYRAPTQFLK